MEILSWTNVDPTTSSLRSQHVSYRFVTDMNTQGNPVTTLYRAGRNREDKVAKFEWSSNGGLGRATIGKNCLPMSDLIRPDPRDYGRTKTFTGPDGRPYSWRASSSTHDIYLFNPHGQVIAFIRPVQATRYPFGDVYNELHLDGSVDTGVILHPPFMDMAVCTAMIFRVTQSASQTRVMA